MQVQTRHHRSENKNSQRRRKEPQLERRKNSLALTSLQTLTFQVKDHCTLEVGAWDEDPGSDDLIGSTTVDISKIMKSGQFKDWITVYYKGKDAGRIYVEMFYIDESGGSQKKADAPAGSLPQILASLPMQYPGGFVQTAPGGFGMPAYAPQAYPTGYPSYQPPLAAMGAISSTMQQYQY